MITNVYFKGAPVDYIYKGDELYYNFTFNPIDLFKEGQVGLIYEPYKIDSLFQNEAGTTLVTASGDPVALVKDTLLGNNNAKQTLSSARPTYKTNPSRLSLDKVDDALVITVPKRIVGTMTIASTTGIATYGVDIPTTGITLDSRYFPHSNIVGIVIREGAMLESDRVKLVEYFVSKGAVESFSQVTSLGLAFYSWDYLTVLPVLDTPNNTSLRVAFYKCTRITNLPLIDTSKVISFQDTLGSCSSLTQLPKWDFSKSNTFLNFCYGCTSLSIAHLGLFDNVITGNFKNAFLSTNLTQVSIDNILTSLVSSGVATGTRIFDQSGGSAPSATGRAAIDTLRSRGWTVTVTGGY